MRHRLHGRGFSRKSAHRKAMFENLAAALIKHEQIKTTLPKAKDLRPIVERLITLGKHGGLANRRRAIAWRRACSPPFFPSVISRSTIGRKSLALGSVVRICSCFKSAAARFSNIAFLWAEVRLKPRWLIRWRMVSSPPRRASRPA